MNRLLWALPLVAIGAILVVLGRGLSLDPRLVESPLIGKPAPAFVSQTLHGGTPTDTDALRGEVTLLNVWASWCVACRYEHPLLNDLAREGTVRIVGLNYKDEPEEARRWLRRLGDPYNWSVVDPSGRIGIDYGVYGVPETFVLDQHGVIRAKHIGPITAEYLRDELRPLILRLQQEPPVRT